ncbi:thiosulfate sulfurtransferase 16, chloroplastic [Ricinus communis]|uniref:Senescence-associated protein DIN1, putative n=1 Tax=Ricinus communis TaxID=3988 RepID=B9SXL0_RICCO|nr:thiosulfate sulfurtransferase 16, chloroplastic [Ricinus communis]EEF31635.1 Senescence-associated protein DIN1, putative [Ricinus communis]|eukprot:XP_002530729.1 thiosulfate sulfurtransferase 16, chloroplastic [Ricinus communis]
MEAKSIVSSATFTSTSLCPSFCPSNLNNRKLLLLPLINNPRRLSIGINQKSVSFCPKAGLRGNLEAVGVPTSVPVRVAHELLLAGHRYLDVRTPEEFSAGHVVGAINIPYMYRVGSGMKKNTKFLEQVSSHFGKYNEIIIGCQSGKRSMMAATDLLSAGYTAVTDIAGGYAAWTQNGLPTEN